MSTPFEIQTLEESVSNKALTFYHFSVNCLKRRYHCVLESSTIDGTTLREKRVCWFNYALGIKV